MRANSLQTQELFIGNSELSLQNILTNNYTINGNFDLWQRGISFSNPNGIYTADRYIVSNQIDTNVSVSRSTTVPNEISTYSLRFETLGTGGSSAYSDIRQTIEDINYKNLLGKYVTLSAYVKIDSSYLGVGGLIGIETDSVDSFDLSTINTTNWVKVSVSSFIQTNASQVNALFRLDRSGITTGLGYNISQVKIEEGLTYTPFINRPFQQELALCQRYFEKSCDHDDILGITIGCNVNLIPTEASVVRVSTAGGCTRFAVPKRTTPTVTIYARNGDSSSINKYNSGVTTYAVSSISGESRLIPFSYLNVATFPTGDFFECNWSADAELY